ncbi:uncharacterized protein L3040_004199 [Drepanopeziza brunnea f. sp. 'multigermtubi']|uniref:Uncharacterized protein n=1 Tax=Marssonina brunnea f. sp. multigermtubi (strain MB_m1) TaxID=1072389 RepID=K1XIF2_MARBU|nr:uncharacterized protein MBM_01195 [Drepanopeziza brunnea f. sp. 'multigermtubi' MB_m1]EKD20513.1 hypothetical protein MBM_01195 [Drepanopeziza brunnea f. sp. 'multigermtubi' MB_m1]KAJ5042806.1 hypothetical protein L3040_004199 [Drepanopeziza brunnea f. sp. 'multigermtubi']
MEYSGPDRHALLVMIVDYNLYHPHDRITKATISRGLEGARKTLIDRVAEREAFPLNEFQEKGRRLRIMLEEVEELTDLNTHLALRWRELSDAVAEMTPLVSEKWQWTLEEFERREEDKKQKRRLKELAAQRTAEWGKQQEAEWLARIEEEERQAAEVTRQRRDRFEESRSKRRSPSPPPLPDLNTGKTKSEDLREEPGPLSPLLPPRKQDNASTKQRVESPGLPHRPHSAVPVHVAYPIPMPPPAQGPTTQASKKHKNKMVFIKKEGLCLYDRRNGETFIELDMEPTPSPTSPSLAQIRKKPEERSHQSARNPLQHEKREDLGRQKSSMPRASGPAQSAPHLPAVETPRKISSREAAMFLNRKKGRGLEDHGPKMDKAHYDALRLASEIARFSWPASPPPPPAERL